MSKLQFQCPNCHVKLKFEITEQTPEIVACPGCNSCIRLAASDPVRPASPSRSGPIADSRIAPPQPAPATNRAFAPHAQQPSAERFGSPIGGSGNSPRKKRNWVTFTIFTTLTVIGLAVVFVIGFLLFDVWLEQRSLNQQMTDLSKPPTIDERRNDLEEQVTVSEPPQSARPDNTSDSAEPTTTIEEGRVVEKPVDNSPPEKPLVPGATEESDAERIVDTRALKKFDFDDSQEFGSKRNRRRPPPRKPPGGASDR